MPYLRIWIAAAPAICLASFGCSGGISSGGNTSKGASAPAGFVAATSTDYAQDLKSSFADPSYLPKYPLPFGMSARVAIGDYVWGASGSPQAAAATDKKQIAEERSRLQTTLEELLLFSWTKAKALHVKPEDPQKASGQNGSKSYALKIGVQTDLPFSETLRVAADSDEAKAKADFHRAALGILGAVFHHTDMVEKRSTAKR